MLGSVLGSLRERHGRSVVKLVVRDERESLRDEVEGYGGVGGMGAKGIKSEQSSADVMRSYPRASFASAASSSSTDSQKLVWHKTGNSSASQAPQRSRELRRTWTREKSNSREADNAHSGEVNT